MRHHDNLLIIGARMPVAGQAKTRLGRDLSDDVAIRLYRAFLADLAIRFPAAARRDGCDLAWGYTPAGADFAALLADLAPDAPPPDHLIPQVGDDWGVRQVNLLRWGADAGYARTVLIASDSPQLAESVATASFAALRDHDVAMGRVSDGGYYLIGNAGFHDIISGAPMSTAHAADAIAAHAADLGLRLAELPASFDVDIGGDLDALVTALRADPARAPKTWEALGHLGLIPSTGT